MLLAARYVGPAQVSVGVAGLQEWLMVAVLPLVRWQHACNNGQQVVLQCGALTSGETVGFGCHIAAHLEVHQSPRVNNAPCEGLPGHVAGRELRLLPAARCRAWHRRTADQLATRRQCRCPPLCPASDPSQHG